MKCWDEYIAYLKDNPEGYWFKSKLYGYGWTPAKPAGWLTTILYVLFLLGFALYSEYTSLVEESPLRFITVVFAGTALLIVICWKTGEPLKWRWGKEEKEQ